jgi:putative flippase GtrA
MSLVRPKIAKAVWRLLPAPLRRKLRGETGNRFVRFVIVAVLALAASQIALFLFLGPAGLSGGISGVAAAAIGALVSYLLSRWAWERKGRPSVIRETLPFWLVSAGAWLVLGLATKLGIHIAASMGAHGLKKTVIVQGTYFLANCVTFFVRFVIFHYLLFADRGSKPTPVAGAPGLAAALDLADGLDPAGGQNPVGRQNPARGQQNPAGGQGTAEVGSSRRPATR